MSNSAWSGFRRSFIGPSFRLVRSTFVSGYRNAGRARARKSPKGERLSEKGKSGTDVSPEPKFCQQIFWTLFSTLAVVVTSAPLAGQEPLRRAAFRIHLLC